MAALGKLMTAMVTPFAADGAVDYIQARRLAKALAASGSDGLIVTGSTGEAPSLGHEEKVRLWTEVKEAVGKETAVVAGAGTYSTRESIALAQAAEQAGADAIMAVVPYYNKPTQEGLYQHFAAVAQNSRLPLIPYNVPSRTITNMSAETTLRVAELPTVAGIKEASSDFDQIAAILRDAPIGFRVWSGNDSDTFGVLALGGYGVISVASHLIGLQIRRLIEHVAAGRPDQAAAEHRRQLALAKGLFVVSNPIPVKYCLNRVGFDVGPLRLPLTPPDARTADFLDRLLTNYAVDLPAGIAA